MSQQPRRTTELLQNQSTVTNYASRPSRTSRILRRTSSVPVRCSVENSSSCERPKNLLSVPLSSRKLRRSVSATPLRTTPNRPISNIGLLSTIDRERLPYDKKFLHSESNRINDSLKVIEHRLGQEFFDRGGIRSMSAKQFIIILDYLLKKLVGNRFQIGHDYVDTVPPILANLNYPHTVNKSWLKTPCPVNNNVVQLLSWLISFDNSGNSEDYFETLEKKYVYPGNEFPEIEFACNFLKSSKKIFYFWNNRDEKEADNLKVKLINEYILKRTGLECSEKLHEEINLLNCKVDELENQKSSEFENQNISEGEFFAKNREIKLKEKQISDLEKMHKKYEKDLKQIKMVTEKKLKLINAAEVKIKNLEDVLNRQKIDVIKRNELIASISELYNDLANREKTILELAEYGSKNQINFSRLIKQKSDALVKVNTYIYKIFNEYDELRNENAHIKYTLKKDFSEKEINLVSNILFQLSQQNSNEIQKFSKNLKNIKSKSVLSKHANEILIKDYSDLENLLENYEKKLEALNLKILSEKLMLKKEIKKLEFSSNELNTMNIKIKENIQIKNKKLSELVDENETLEKAVENDSQDILDLEENNLKHLEGFIDCLERAMN